METELLSFSLLLYCSITLILLGAALPFIQLNIGLFSKNKSMISHSSVSKQNDFFKMLSQTILNALLFKWNTGNLFLSIFRKPDKEILMPILIRQQKTRNNKNL